MKFVAIVFTSIVVATACLAFALTVFGVIACTRYVNMSNIQQEEVRDALWW